MDGRNSDSDQKKHDSSNKHYISIRIEENNNYKQKRRSTR